MIIVSSERRGEDMLSMSRPEGAAERRFAASPFFEWCVVRHQLLLGAVAGEADDNYATRLHPDDDSLAEARVDHVVAERERCAGGRLGARRRLVVPGAGELVRPLGRWLLLAVGELDRDLVEEARRQVPVAAAEQRPGAGEAQVELALGARDADVAEPPLLLEVARLHRAAVREHA